MRIKKNDHVIILAGKERGMIGRVLEVLPARNAVRIEGRNIVHRHRKANAQGEEGGIVPTEAPISAANVALYSEKSGRGVRVSARFVGANGQLFVRRDEALDSFGEQAPAALRKVRYAAKTDEIFD